MRLKVLHNSNYILKKKFVIIYVLIICVICILYIYMKKPTHFKPVIFIPIDRDENIIGFPNNIVSQDRIQRILIIKRQIKTINRKQIVQNINTFGSEIALVIVIQVQHKKYYLEQLIGSLKQATGINKTLLIFSHSYCNDDINSLVRNTSFAKVLQIFYPYTVQLHPAGFPGNDHKVCDDLVNCNKGNRNPLLMQPKHHWWWKAAFVFGEIRILKNYNASVLFLEEDQYVTQDCIYIVKVLMRLASVIYPNCNMITLGGSDRNSLGYNVKQGTVTLKSLSPSDYVGLVFNRSVWDIMSSVSEHFCRYTDNRWINSLINLVRKSTLKDFRVVSIDSARVIRFSGCPENRTKCHMVEKVEKVERLIERINGALFPQNIAVKETIDQQSIVSNGIWRDARDQELCLYYSNSYLKEEYK